MLYEKKTYRKCYMKKIMVNKTYEIVLEICRHKEFFIWLNVYTKQFFVYVVFINNNNNCAY